VKNRGVGQGSILTRKVDRRLGGKLSGEKRNGSWMSDLSIFSRTGCVGRGIKIKYRQERVGGKEGRKKGEPRRRCPYRERRQRYDEGEEKLKGKRGTGELGRAERPIKGHGAKKKEIKRKRRSTNRRVIRHWIPGPGGSTSKRKEKRDRSRRPEKRKDGKRIERPKQDRLEMAGGKRERVGGQSNGKVYAARAKTKKFLEPMDIASHSNS